MMEQRDIHGGIQWLIVNMPLGRPRQPAWSDGHVPQPEQLAAPHPRLLQRPALPTAVAATAAPAGVTALDA